MSFTISETQHQIRHRDGVKVQTLPSIHEPSTKAPCSIGDRDLEIFEELPSQFDPATWWLDGHYPQHPHFDNAEKIYHLSRMIKDRLLDCIIAGCRLLLERSNDVDLLSTFNDDRSLWRAAVSMHKYGVVYLGSRTECRHEFLPALQANEERFNLIERFLASGKNATRAINYGVHSWVNAKNIKAEHPGKLVPPRAISSISLHHVAVRPEDFGGPSDPLLDETDALWDLHDFAHHTVTSLSPSLYGSKYFSHLAKLPPSLTSLIRSPGMKTSNPKPRCSDGVVFSEFLTGLFGAEMAAIDSSQKSHTYASLTDSLASSLASYLLQERSLTHPSTGASITMKDRITPERLAVLAQNKAYELTASEIEQRVMTRGGPEGDARDELDAMTPAAKIRHLAASRRWMYFEVRNTVKHRAHKLAYQKVALRLLQEEDSPDHAPLSEWDRELVGLAMDNMAYKGWRRNEVPNLWQAVMERQAVEAASDK